MFIFTSKRTFSLFAYQCKINFMRNQKLAKQLLPLPWTADHIETLQVNSNVLIAKAELTYIVKRNKKENIGVSIFTVYFFVVYKCYD